MNNLLYNYILPCTRGDPILIEKTLAGKLKGILNQESSPEQIREYFLGKHNLEAYLKNDISARVHMAIPYVLRRVNPTPYLRIYEPFFQMPKGFQKFGLPLTLLEQAKERKAIPNVLEEGDIIILHNAVVVDHLDPQEIKQYESLFIQL